MQPVQCVLLFLVLAGNSALFHALTLVARSYALLRFTCHCVIEVPITNLYMISIEQAQYKQCST